MQSFYTAEWLQVQNYCMYLHTYSSRHPTLATSSCVSTAYYVLGKKTAKSIWSLKRVLLAHLKMYICVAVTAMRWSQDREAFTTWSLNSRHSLEELARFRTSTVQSPLRVASMCRHSSFLQHAHTHTHYNYTTTHTHTYVHTYMHVLTCMHAHIHACTHTHTHTHTRARAHTHTHAHTHTSHTHTHTHTSHTHAHTHLTHTHTRSAHIHAHIHTHTCACTYLPTMPANSTLPPPQAPARRVPSLLHEMQLTVPTEDFSRQYDHWWVGGGAKGEKQQLHPPTVFIHTDTHTYISSMYI